MPITPSLWEQLNALRAFFPYSTQWDPERDIPDLTGKVVFITGGNSGIGSSTNALTIRSSVHNNPVLLCWKGKEMARHLLVHGARVYIACRSEDKAKDTVEELKSSTGKADSDIIYVLMDLADLASVKNGVADFLSKESTLHILYNSAGVMWIPRSEVTIHGHDVAFGVHVLGHFYLTRLLLPTLLATVTSTPGEVRIVNMSSNAHFAAPMAKRDKNGNIIDGKAAGVWYGTLVKGEERDKVNLDEAVLYPQSKVGVVLFSNALGRKYGAQGIVSIALDPGSISTGLTRYGSRTAKWILSFIMKPVSKGIITPLWAGTSPEAAGLNGQYVFPFAHPARCRSDLEDEDEQERLWEWCEGEVKKFAPPA